MKRAGIPVLTGGAARGRLLAAPVPADVRPTSARVREALFSMVGQDLAGVRILDAFGGSGLVGLEAWSRGAAVTVVEQDRSALAAIRANVKALGATVDVRAGDVHAVAPALPPFDGVFADPPYGADLGRVLALLAPLAVRWLVVESDTSDAPPTVRGGLVLDRRRDYGRTALTVYRRPAPS